MSSIFCNQCNQERKNHSVKNWIQCSLDLIIFDSFKQSLAKKINSNN